MPVTLSIFNMSEELLDICIDTSPNVRYEMCKDIEREREGRKEGGRKSRTA